MSEALYEIDSGADGLDALVCLTITTPINIVFAVTFGTVFFATALTAFALEVGLALIGNVAGLFHLEVTQSLYAGARTLGEWRSVSTKRIGYMFKETVWYIGQAFQFGNGAQIVNPFGE